MITEVIDSGASLGWLRLITFLTNTSNTTASTTMRVISFVPKGLVMVAGVE